MTLFGIGLALAATTLLAPRAFRSQAMALWFRTPAAGQAITSQLVSAAEDLAGSYVPYFGTIGGVTLGLVALFFLVAPWIQRRSVEGEEDARRLSSTDPALDFRFGPSCLYSRRAR